MQPPIYGGKKAIFYRSGCWLVKPAQLEMIDKIRYFFMHMRKPEKSGLVPLTCTILFTFLECCLASLCFLWQCLSFDVLPLEVDGWFSATLRGDYSISISLNFFNCDKMQLCSFMAKKIQIQLETTQAVITSS